MDSVSVAIDAWVKSCAIDRGRRAEALLDRVTEMGSIASLQDDDGLVVYDRQRPVTLTLLPRGRF